MYLLDGGVLYDDVPGGLLRSHSGFLYPLQSTLFRVVNLGDKVHSYVLGILI